ncbi:hypothetical protein FRB96_007707 [Tulasnella sp. 330]|nr:hypothetical protein FRB96_007707 [Tulasnella sp. 330]KAG8880810.1 hypothetical protein FRB98_004723 [Tulasnella sp. 332]KAG8881769.1 hypothetical protein FRB97_009178 [Tulasnella sp. 331]
MDTEAPSTEPQSMREILNAPLAEFEALTNQLFLSLASPSSLRSQPPPSVEAFIQCDKALAAALAQAREHQIKQGRIERLKEEIVQLEWRLRDICLKVTQDKTELETMIRIGEDRIKAMDRAEKSPLPTDIILTYAANLGSYSSAPPMDTDPSTEQQAPPAFRPPYPPDWILRRGLLASQSGMLPEVVGEEKPVGEPIVSPNAQPKPNHPIERQQRHPGHYRPTTVSDLFELDLNPEDE